MANRSNQNLITISREAVRRGLVILDLEKYKRIGEKIAEFEGKEKLLRDLARFEKLARWGRDFASKRNITQKQILEND